MIIQILNGNLLDTESMDFMGERHITLSEDRIIDVSETLPTGRADLKIDVRGQNILPGFIDGHVHHVITTMNFSRLAKMSSVEKSLAMGKLAEATVLRGFTTVRDTGGHTTGLVRAIESGLCEGPRIIRSGRAISQTGGHGDVEAALDAGLCACQVLTNDFSHVADGPDAVRSAVRHELRDGSQFIKLMTSGGVASPSDPFDCVQYTPEEVRAATVETDHRKTYTTAHAYQREAISLAIENGVRCIEHGNLVDVETAERMAVLDVIMVPTLVTYLAMADIGAKIGLPQRNVSKNEGVFESGQQSVETARQAGVRLGFGTDLLGEAQTWQNREFEIRADLEESRDVLDAMYRVNPKLCGLEGEIGRTVVGAFADLVVTKIDPIQDLAGLADPENALSLIVSNGRIARNDF